MTLRPKGYIYIRSHPSYMGHLKVGITTNIPDRESTYLTGEFQKGEFDSVKELDKSKLKIIDNHLKNVLEPYHIQDTGGTEFYQSGIHTHIKQELDKLHLQYRTLEKAEIQSLIRRERVKRLYKRINHIKFIKALNTHNQPIPDIDQLEILEKIINHYTCHNKGKLIEPCGIGKTLISLFAVQRLQSKSICVGVPTIQLQTQFIKEILRLFPNRNNIFTIGGSKPDSITSIQHKLQSKTRDPVFVITTYDSSHQLVHTDLSFDFKIGDEAHHLVGVEKDRDTLSYDKFHLIHSLKTLFMTATERIIDSESSRTVYSMDNETLFGPTIDEKSIKWAIDNHKITDYYLLMVKNHEEQMDVIIESCGLELDPRYQTACKQKELFISAYVTLKCILENPSLTHLLIFCNSIQHAQIVDQYIQLLLDKRVIHLPQLYHKHTDTQFDLDTQLKEFQQSPNGIISCVYKLGEGSNLPYLNGVVFAEQMGSDIRIVQSALRPNRLDKSKPDKVAFIIVPYIESDTYGENHYQGFEKVLQLVRKMGNADENIDQRLRLTTIHSTNTQITKNPRNMTASNDIDQDNELERVKIRLRWRKALTSPFSQERDEFHYHKSINQHYHITSKQDFLNLEPSHEAYHPNPKDYFVKNGLWTNWYDFLGIDTSAFIQDKGQWKTKCQELHINSVQMYQKKCSEYPSLPLYPGEFYKGFTNIEHQLGLLNKRRR